MGSENERIVYLTIERYTEIETEMNHLKTKGRSEMAARIAEARSYGDLSENAEYDAAKEMQGLMELKISKLEQTLRQSQIIKSEDLPNDKIYILSRVQLRNTKTQKVTNYTLVSAEEADLDSGKLAVSSPIGKALIGKKEGETVNIQVPAGTVEFLIEKISR